MKSKMYFILVILNNSLTEQEARVPCVPAFNSEVILMKGWKSPGPNVRGFHSSYHCHATWMVGVTDDLAAPSDTLRNLDFFASRSDDTCMLSHSLGDGSSKD